MKRPIVHIVLWPDLNAVVWNPSRFEASLSNHQLDCEKRTYMRIVGICLAMICLALGSPAQGENLRVGGTGVALGGMRILGDAFEKRHPEVTVEVLPSLGSSGGVKALIAGAIDLSVTSRVLKDSETETGLSATPYATTPLAIVTSTETGTDGITMQQLAAMYAGLVQEWPSGERVRVVLRPKSEADIRVLRGLSDEMAQAIDSAYDRPGLVLATNDQDNAEILQRLTGSIGAMALGQIATEKRRLKVLKLDGHLPTLRPDEQADEGSDTQRRNMSMVKTLFIVRPENASATAAAFYTFVFSPEGQLILASYDHTPVR